MNEKSPVFSCTFYVLTLFSFSYSAGKRVLPAIHFFVHVALDIQ